MIRGQTSDEAEILSAVLIVVLRLRNNLFHGEKWTYGIKGQLDNFRNANNVLMSVIDLHRRFRSILRNASYSALKGLKGAAVSFRRWRRFRSGLANPRQNPWL